MSAAAAYESEVLNTLAHTNTAEWNALVPAGNPFFTHEFLRTLEASGCVGPETSWHPAYITLRDPAHDDRLIGALAFYFKFDSYGEYVFDHAWADAYMRSGLRYYPKGLVAAPFTPTNGMRILTHPDYNFAQIAGPLVEAMESAGAKRGLSSLHLLFVTETESEFLNERGYLPRLSTQFHWLNRGYEKFDDFLAELRSSKRKQLKKERRAVADQGIVVEVLTGDAIKPEHMEIMYRFYMDTGHRKWGQPYLNRRWFELILENFRSAIVLVVARNADGRIIAGTLNFHTGDRLFGRYWGADDEYPCLHFELCYYQLIDYAIRHRVSVFEAGAQGEHKFLRGFVTRPCFSAHRMLHPEGQRAIGQFLETERDYVQKTILEYNSQSPLKHIREESRGALDDSVTGQSGD